MGQVTGGDPGVTGIYYDDTFNHDVFPAGTTNCAGPVPGGEAAYTEADDINQLSLDAGQGLSGLPGSILRMTPNPRDVINPANLPVNPETCQPIYPDQYLRVNTIFNVARQAGLRVVYTGGQSKIAEHGGAGFQDRNVPILVDVPGLRQGVQINTQVETTQIAPTILRLLGLAPQALQAVRIEHTRALPGVPGGWNQLTR